MSNIWELIVILLSKFLDFSIVPPSNKLRCFDFLPEIKIKHDVKDEVADNYEVLKLRQLMFPLGINSPTDLVEWINRAGVEFSFKDKILEHNEYEYITVPKITQQDLAVIIRKIIGRSYVDFTNVKYVGLFDMINMSFGDGVYILDNRFTYLSNPYKNKELDHLYTSVGLSFYMGITLSGKGINRNTQLLVAVNNTYNCSMRVDYEDGSWSAWRHLWFNEMVPIDIFQLKVSINKIVLDAIK